MHCNENFLVQMLTDSIISVLFQALKFSVGITGARFMGRIFGCSDLEIHLCYARKIEKIFYRLSVVSSPYQCTESLNTIVR